MSTNEAQPSPASVTMDAFFTRQRANEGVEFPLDFPDGTPSPHWLRIRGIDSDAFRAARAESDRRLAETVISKASPEVQTAVEDEERAKLLASLVAGWSFPTPCTRENVTAFLREAPQFAQQIDRVAARRSLFFKNGSANSTPSPK